MEIMSNCIEKIYSEEELNRTVRVVIDSSSYGGIEKITCGFLKRDWKKIKHDRSYLETKELDEKGIDYFEKMSDTEWYERYFKTALKDFSDEEIVEEFNRRLENPLFHNITIKGYAEIKRS